MAAARSSARSSAAGTLTAIEATPRPPTSNSMEVNPVWMKGAAHLGHTPWAAITSRVCSGCRA